MGCYVETSIVLMKFSRIYSVKPQYWNATLTADGRKIYLIILSFQFTEVFTVNGLFVVTIFVAHVTILVAQTDQR